MVLLRHITAPSPAYAVHYYSAVYTLPCLTNGLSELNATSRQCPFATVPSSYEQYLALFVSNQASHPGREEHLIAD